MSLNLVGLASRIKTARKSRGWTLDQLAEKTGLGKGLLSKVENFRVTPSLPTIGKIAAALSISLDQLFEGLDEEANVSVVRSDEKKEIQRNTEDSTIEYYDLAYQRSSRRMDPFELVIPAGGGRDSKLSHEGEEFLRVLEGEIVLIIEDEEYQLAAGDSVYFSAESPHCVKNVGAGEAKMLSMFCR